MHNDIEYIDPDTHHAEISQPPPNMRAQIIALNVQQHGTDLYEGKQKEILGSNDDDDIHVPPSAIYSIHSLTWRPNKDVPAGEPGHWQLDKQTLTTHDHNRTFTTSNIDQK